MCWRRLVIPLSFIYRSAKQVTVGMYSDIRRTTDKPEYLVDFLTVWFPFCESGILIRRKTLKHTGLSETKSGFGFSTTISVKQARRATGIAAGIAAIIVPALDRFEFFRTFIDSSDNVLTIRSK